MPSMTEDRMPTVPLGGHATYEAPRISRLGTVHELTGCEKLFGSSDGHTMGGASIVCSSA
jgi:hypothetical protein